MGQYSKLKSDTFLFAISNFASKILAFLLLPLYTKALSTQELGTVDIIITVINIVFPIFTLAIIEAIMRFSFDKSVDSKEILSIAIIFYLFSNLIIGLIIFIGSIITDLPDLYLWYLFLLYSGYSLSMIVSYYFRGNNKVELVALQGIVQTVIVVICSVVFLLGFKLGIKGYILSLVIAYYVSSFAVCIKDKTLLGIEKDFYVNKTLVKNMLRYSIPIIPGKIAWWLNNSSDRYFIVSLLGVTSNGLYSVAHKIPSVMIVFSDIFNQAWQISAIELYQEKERKGNFYAAVHENYIQFMIMCASVVILFSEVLGWILFSRDYLQAWVYVPPLIVSAVFSSMSGFYHSIFRAAKLSKELCITVLVGTVTNITLNSLFVFRLGLMGAAYATMIAFIVEWGVSYLYTKKIMELRVDIKKLFSLYGLIILEASCFAVTYLYRYVIGIICVLIIMLLARKTIYTAMRQICRKRVK